MRKEGEKEKEKSRKRGSEKGRKKKKGKTIENKRNEGDEKEIIGTRKRILKIAISRCLERQFDIFLKLYHRALGFR